MEKEVNFKISGDDILAFLRKVFKAGLSRRITFQKNSGTEIFRINLILFALIVFIIPVIALLLLIFLIVTNFSIAIEKK